MNKMIKSLIVIYICVFLLLFWNVDFFFVNEEFLIAFCLIIFFIFLYIFLRKIVLKMFFFKIDTFIFHFYI